MLKTFRYRLYPTKAQQTLLNLWLGICCWVYNKTLNVRKKAWEQKEEKLSFFDTNKKLTRWKKKEPWLKQVHSQVLQQVQKRVDLAFGGFFRRSKAGEAKAGYPRFKSKERYHSLCWPQYPGGCYLEGAVLEVKGIGSLKLNLHRPVEGQVKTTTIKRTPTGKWFVSFAVEVGATKQLPLSPKIVGIDVGLTSFLTTNTGATVENPRFFRHDEKDLARAQRKLSKAKKGSKKRAHRRKAVAHIHERIKNRRLNWVHELVHELISKYAILCIEDLNVKGMLTKGKHTGLSKSISDAAWSLFRHLLVFKAEEAGRLVVAVNPAFTSQVCSRCGYRVKKTLADRVHRCPRCGLVLPRDQNSAKVIRTLGIQCLEEAIGFL